MLEEILDVSINSPEHLQDKLIGPRIFKAYKKLKSENISTDGYLMLLMGYARSPTGDFESYLRNVIGLDEDVIQLFFKQCNSNFVTYEIAPGIYSIKFISEVVYTMGDHEGTLQIEYDDIILKTKSILTRFGGTSGILRFDEKSFFSNLIGIAPYWGYKPTNPIPVDHLMFTLLKNLSTLDKIQLKCDVFYGSVVIGLRQSILYTFVLDKPPGYKVFCEPETIH